MLITLFGKRSFPGLILRYPFTSQLRIKPIHIFLPLAALIAVGIFQTKKAAGMLSYFIRSLAVSFDGQIPILRITVAVQNPSNEQFTIKSIVGTLYSNDQKAANISMFQTVVINPNSQIDLPIIARLDTAAIVSDLITFLTRGSGNPIEIRLDAKANVNSFVTDLDLKYKLT